MAHSNETQGYLMQPFLNKFPQFLLWPGTNVQIERTWKSHRERIFVVELKLKLLSLFHYEQIV